MLGTVERQVRLGTASASNDNAESPEIAYVMKGFPRRSEPFISNEILLLEQGGTPVHVFALKGFSDDRDYPPVNQLRADVTYAPEDLSVESRAFTIWLWKNLPRYAASHAVLASRSPWRYVATLVYAIWLSFRYAKRPESWLPRPRRVFLKDFLRAGFVARQIVEMPSIRHLHGHFCHGSTTITMLTAKLCGLPFSFTAHAKDIYLERLNPGNLLQQKIYQADFVVTCTDFNRQHLQQLAPRSRTIHTIYHGLDLHAFRPQPRDESATHVPQILSVGRFVEKKGFPLLIEACRRLKDAGLRFHCRIVGTPDVDSPVVAELINRYQLQDVVSILPAVSQVELRSYYQDSDIFVLPCLVTDNGDRDGIPNVLAEAMAMELAVVSTQVSGIPEIVDDGENGRLVPQRDVAALTATLHELLTDVQQRHRLGAAARQRIHEVFDSKRTTETLRERFNRSIAARTEMRQ